jgi:hypothetical protein
MFLANIYAATGIHDVAGIITVAKRCLYCCPLSLFYRSRPTVAGVPNVACVPAVASIRDVDVVLGAADVAYLPTVTDLPSVTELPAVGNLLLVASLPYPFAGTLVVAGFPATVSVWLAFPLLLASLPFLAFLPFLYVGFLSW